MLIEGLWYGVLGFSQGHYLSTKDVGFNLPFLLDVSEVAPCAV